jgi:hypothetical protein
MLAAEVMKIKEPPATEFTAVARVDLPVFFALSIRCLAKKIYVGGACSGIVMYQPRIDENSGYEQAWET